MTVFTEALHPLAFMVSEEEGFRSRDSLTIATNQTILAGTVLGAAGVVASETATVTAAAGNTGDGAVTMDVTAPIRGDAVDGQYTVEFITGGSSTAAFNVLGPTGAIVGTGKVGTGFAGPIKFAIADDAGAHYAVADRIFVQVLRRTGKDDLWSALNLSATDGTQVASAIAGYPVITTSATAKISGITRAAEVRAADLAWPAGITVAQIAEATNQLLAKGIVSR